MAGGDKNFQPPFFLQKNGERSRKASLHCTVRHNFTQKTKFSSLPRRNKMKPGHLHQIPEALLACPAIARRATADEVAPFGRLRRRFAYAPLACHGVICGADEDG